MKPFLAVPELRPLVPEHQLFRAGPTIPPPVMKPPEQPSPVLGPVGGPSQAQRRWLKTKVVEESGAAVTQPELPPVRLHDVAHPSIAPEQLFPSLSDEQHRNAVFTRQPHEREETGDADVR